MAIETTVKLPQWGMGMLDGEVLQWLKREGEQVDRGDDLVEIDAAKVVSYVPAPVAGTLVKILAEVGAVVPVGAPLGVLRSDDDG